MLQKYEAEVRNHIKIEQQLKLHIECLQDKLEDAEKAARVPREMEEAMASQRELKRYKELLDIREKEVETLQKELARLTESSDEIRLQVDTLERENRILKTNRTMVKESKPTTDPGKMTTAALLEELSLSRR